MSVFFLFLIKWVSHECVFYELDTNVSPTFSTLCFAGWTSSLYAGNLKRITFLRLCISVLLQPLLVKCCVWAHVYGKEVLLATKRSVTVKNGFPSRLAASPLLLPRIRCAAQSAISILFHPALAHIAEAKWHRLSGEGDRERNRNGAVALRGQ